ncbi:hypothetical protein [Rhizobium chutanense]|uniref:hypothetical protein n=1 Tax=Rhizobium chutanense TaxID=2035448 RepID=UPI001179AA52|nr:hypothetical protein [Rhizobium chutanense]
MFFISLSCFQAPEGAVFDLKQAIGVSEETPNAPWRPPATAGPKARWTQRRIACGRTVRAVPVTCTGRAEIMGKADGCLNSTAGPTGLRHSGNHPPKRFRLGFAAGFRGLRNAVPFCRIKAKKIPIVQPNFNFLTVKASLKIFI